MTDEQFKLGDAVQHKSGGPKMIVCYITNKQHASHQCEWFDNAGKLQHGMFHPDVLEPHKPVDPADLV